jgi:hypothetical protein
LIFIVLLFLAIAVVTVTEVPGIPPQIQATWWLGFGPEFLLAVFVTGFGLVLFRSRENAVVSTVVWILGLLVGLVWALPSLINVPWTYDQFHAPQVMNDVLAFYAGRFPLSDYIPQYTLVLGWPVALAFPLMDGFTGPQLLTLLLTLYLSLLSIISAGLAVFAAHRLLPSRLRPLSPLFVLPLFLHVAGSLSATPARLLFPLVVFVLLIHWSKGSGKRPNLILGILVGLSILNNPEIGAVTALATLGGLLVLTRQRRSIAIANLLIGLFLPLASYSVLGILSGKPIEIAQVAAYARAFSAGYYSLPMPTIGTYVIVLMVGASATILGALRAQHVRSGRDRTAAVGAVFAGLFVLGSFAYYVGRSSSSGQLQFLLPFTALAIVGIVGLVGIPKFGVPSGVKQLTLSHHVIRDMLVLSLPALALATVVQMPGLARSWNSLLPSQGAFAAPLVEADAVQSLKSLGARGATDTHDHAIGLNHSNLLFLQTGMRSALPFTAVTDFQISPVFQHLLCREISKEQRGVIVSRDVGQQIVSDCPNAVLEEPSSSRLVTVTAKD